MPCQGLVRQERELERVLGQEPVPERQRAQEQVWVQQLELARRRAQEQVWVQQLELARRGQVELRERLALEQQEPAELGLARPPLQARRLRSPLEPLLAWPLLAYQRSLSGSGRSFPEYSAGPPDR